MTNPIAIARGFLDYDGPEVGLGVRQKRRTIKNNAGWQSSAGVWSVTNPRVQEKGKPDDWGSETFEFSHGVTDTPLQLWIRDMTPGGRRALVGERLSDDPQAWWNVRPAGGNNVDADFTVTGADFPGLWDGASWSIVAGAGMVKDTVSVSDKTLAPAEFAFTVKCGPHHTVELRNGCICLVDTRTGAVKITKRAPVAWNGLGEMPLDGGDVRCAWEYRGESAGLHTVALVPVLDDVTGQAYTVDPTDTITATAIEDTLYYQAQPHFNYGGFLTRGMMAVGDSNLTNQIARALGRILNPDTNIPAGTLTAVRFMFYRVAIGGAPNGGTIESYTVASGYEDWVEGTATGATQAGSVDWVDRVHATSSWSVPGGAIGTDFDSGNIGTLAYAAYTSGPNVLTTFTFSDLTPFAAWRDLTKPNGGMMFRAASEGTGADNYHGDVSTENATDKPYFEIDTTAAVAAAKVHYYRHMVGGQA